ncbi:hypothetical protein B7486_12910 [cyanobacterium TDX16]|nr:hypothetical protein B7486_12910 [cyanobacterium TDX16]
MGKPVGVRLPPRARFVLLCTYLHGFTRVPAILGRSRFILHVYSRHCGVLRHWNLHSTCERGPFEVGVRRLEVVLVRHLLTVADPFTDQVLREFQVAD